MGSSQDLGSFSSGGGGGLEGVFSDFSEIFSRKIVLYRKGAPSGSSSAWFTDIFSALRYDGEVNGEDIYYMVLSREEFEDFFRENGIGYVLIEGARKNWSYFSMLVKELPMNCPLLKRIEGYS